MWAEWQAKQNVTTDPNADYAGQFVDAEGNPAAATSTSAMDTTALGYSYDIVERLRSSSIPVPDIIGQLSDDELQRLQAESQARTLGGGDNQQTSMLDVATNIRVVAPDILKDIAATRLFRRTSEAGRSGLGLEQRRLTARITEVTPPESGSDLLVNVFVNCPYLSPETPYSDPHFAGSFSFFGRMAGHHGHEFLIDITEPVQALTQEGRIDPEKIEVQFMPLSASPDAVSKATFKAGKVEILSS